MANYQNLKAAIDQVIKANGQKEITGPVLNDTLKAIVNSLGAGYQFMGVATPSTNPGTPDQNVFYIAGQAGTYTNFNSIILPNGVSVLKWNGSWSSETVVAGDGVFDISAYKATGGTLATFADLSAALDGGNNIPYENRKGGMSVKFVQSSDNKYVQARCMANSFTTDVTQWQGVDDEPTAGSDNLVESGGVAAKQIKLAAFASSQVALNDGDVYYNIIAKELRLRKNENQYDVIPFLDGAIYTYNNTLYIWNGTDLVIRGAEIKVEQNQLSGHNDIKRNEETIGIVPSVDNITDLYDSIIYSKNLISIDDCVTGALDTNGVIGSQAYYKTTGFIRLKAGQTVSCNKTFIRLFEYDLDKNIILSTNVANVSSHTQVNDGYIRASFGTTNLQTIMLSLGNQVPEEYSPYQRVLKEDIFLNEKGKDEIKKEAENQMKIVTEKKGLPSKSDITDSLVWENGYGYNTNGEKVDGALKCVKISVSYQDIVKATAASTPRYTVIFDKSGTVLSSSEYNITAYCPKNSAYMYFTFGDTISVTKVEKTSNALINNALEVTYGTNYLNRTKLVDGYSVNPTTGNEDVFNDGCHTDFIPVKEGEYVILGDGVKTIRYVRRFAAYNDLKQLMPSAGNNNGGNNYLVPEGVSFVIFSINNSNLHDDSRINRTKDAKLLRYEPYSESLMPTGTMDLNALKYNIKNRPLTTIPSLLESCCYKPLGVLSKPYICLTSDDGYTQMATESIPLAIQQDIPISFFIMKGSPVLDTPEYIETIQDAIENGHCELGQHGYTPFIDYSEDQLNAYFEQEKEYWDTLGFEMKASAPPTGAYTKMTNAVCGGRFGINRDANADLYYGGSGCFANGPRSNIYGLSSLGILGHSLDTNKSYIDLAYQNNWLLVIHFHDFELNNIPAGETTMTLLEMIDALITYAKGKGITFVKASDIPNLI